VGAVMREADVDVCVFIDRGLPWPPRRVLVPFASGVQDAVAVRLAARIALRHSAALTVLAVVRPGQPLPPLGTLDPAPVVRMVESASPVAAVLAAAATHDLTVLGVGEGWQLAPQAFGLRSERIAVECPSSLLVVSRRE
jgi:hypothetical protein